MTREVGEDPVAGLDAGASQGGYDGDSVDVERGRQGVGGFTGQVALDDEIAIGICQSSVFSG